MAVYLAVFLLALVATVKGAPSQEYDDNFEGDIILTEEQEEVLSQQDKPFENQEYGDYFDGDIVLTEGQEALLNQPFNKPFENQDKPFENQDKPFENQDRPFENQDRPFENQDKPFENQDENQEYGDYFDGDIVLTEEQEALLNQQDEPFAKESAVTRKLIKLWPRGMIPYVLDRSLNSRARSAIYKAVRTFARQTCIRFVPRRGQKDYVRFFPGNGCYSYIGRTRRGKQDISIGRGCETEGIVIHEMFHALGRWHEQSRPDRDRYVKINYANIIPRFRSNFRKLSTSVVTTQGVPYDIRSIMQYSAYAFSSNRKPTIEPRNRRIPLSALGQLKAMTSRDLMHVKKLYCKKTC